MSATHDERIREIYRQYIELICPWIIQFELLANKYPIGILNEIRSTFSHLSKFHLSNDAAVKERNLSKAESHSKRTILDCFKYICTVYEDKYIEFENMYNGVDLSFIDNGEFLPKLQNIRSEAVDLLLDARYSDLLINSDNEAGTDASIDSAYNKYEKALIKYTSLYNLIKDSYKKADVLKKKVIEKERAKLKREHIGWIIGIIGIVLSIVLFIINLS